MIDENQSLKHCSMAELLSEGAFMKLALGEDFANPVVQVLNHKVVSDGSRFRLLISDGKSLEIAVLASHLSSMIGRGELEYYSIIRLNKHVSVPLENDGNTKQLLLILELEVLKTGSLIGRVIGTPIPVDDTGIVTNIAISSTPSSNSIPTHKRNESVANDSVLNSPTPELIPIDSLSRYWNNWVIKARVVTKSPVRTWANAKGEGRLFSVDLVDSSGEIRATGFGWSVDKFYHLLREGKIYLFSGALVKKANKKFSTLNNKYEITFGNGTQINMCVEDRSIPTLYKFNFKRLSDVQGTETQSVLDVIGICKSTSDIIIVTSNNDKRELKKRDVTLVDDSLASVTLTLWETQAETFDGSTQPVLAIKCARVNEFMGQKSLGLISGSGMKLNPDILESHRLRAWYDSLNEYNEFNVISTRTEDGGESKFTFIKEALISGTTGKSFYFNCHATVMTVRSNKPVYKACPAPKCRKKVIVNNTGQYTCEKCNREYDSFKYCFLLNANISDFSGSTWITLFQDQAEQLLGASSEEVSCWKEDDFSRYNQVFSKVAFKDFQLRLRAKMETYKDKRKLKMTALSVKPVDYTKRCTYMISEFKKMI